MGLATDILASWRHPAATVRRLRGQGRSEPFAFGLLVTFLMLALVAQAPYMARLSYFQPEVPLVQRMVAAGLGLLASVPLWYLLAAIGHGIARLFGRNGSYYDGRLALFWALVTIAPAMLIQGLLLAFLGATGFVQGLGFLIMIGFLAFWIILLNEVEPIQ